jgi:hypothetical protein
LVHGLGFVGVLLYFMQKDPTFQYYEFLQNWGEDGGRGTFVLGRMVSRGPLQADEGKKKRE